MGENDILENMMTSTCDRSEAAAGMQRLGKVDEVSLEHSLALL